MRRRSSLAQKCFPGFFNYLYLLPLRYFGLGCLPLLFYQWFPPVVSTISHKNSIPTSSADSCICSATTLQEINHPFHNLLFSLIFQFTLYIYFQLHRYLIILCRKKCECVLWEPLQFFFQQNLFTWLVQKVTFVCFSGNWILSPIYLYPYGVCLHNNKFGLYSKYIEEHLRRGSME